MWVLYGLVTACLRASLVLIQEKLNIQPFIFSIWTKIYCAVFVLPFVCYYGVPSDPLFYIYCFGSASLWAIADIIALRAIPIVGGGVFARTIPLSFILNFLLWFAIDPDLILRYMSQPLLSGFILLVLIASTYFAMRLNQCEVTKSALKRIWFVIVAFVFGPLMAMLASKHAPQSQGPWSFTLFESFFMLFLWGVYMGIRKPVPIKLFVSKFHLKFGAICGLIMAVMVTTYLYGLYHSDNPAYMLAIISLEGVLVSVVHRIIKKKDDSDIIAGIGIVMCVIALILAKGQLT